MGKLDRVRWDCRRGLLELDLVLERFLAQHLEQLAPAQLAAFKELLDYEDNDLLDLVMGRTEPVTQDQRALARLLRSV